MKEFFKKIKNPVLRLAFKLIERAIERAIVNIADLPTQVAAHGLLDLSSDYVVVLTDDDPDDRQQVKEILQANTEKHIAVGVDVIKAGIVKIKNENVQKDALEVLEILELLLVKEVK